MVQRGNFLKLLVVMFVTMIVAVAMMVAASFIALLASFPFHFISPPLFLVACMFFMGAICLILALLFGPGLFHQTAYVYRAITGDVTPQDYSNYLTQSKS